MPGRPMLSRAGGWGRRRAIPPMLAGAPPGGKLVETGAGYDSAADWADAILYKASLPDIEWPYRPAIPAGRCLTATDTAIRRCGIAAAP